MSKAAAAVQEPTMEEILASIRRIVSDDEPEAVTAQDDNVLELTPDMMDPAPEANTPAAGAGLGALAVNEMSDDAFADAEMPDDIAQLDAPAFSASKESRSAQLMSGAAGQAVASAFGNLNHLVMSQNARTLDDIVTEMMRPMLREWLDDNLPPLVERLVKDEIQRISRAQ